MGSRMRPGGWRLWRGFHTAPSDEDPWALERGLLELGLELRDVATARPSSEEDLGRMMRSCGLSPEEVPPSHLAALRDGERVCAHCRAVRRCRRYLAAGVRDGPPAFCPNAELFRMLRRIAHDTPPPPPASGS